MEEKIITNSNIIIENRKKFTLTGVKDVLSFDDETITAETFLGKLVIKGMNLHILNFDTSTYDLYGEGKINALVYTAQQNEGNFFTKLFR